MRIGSDRMRRVAMVGSFAVLAGSVGVGMAYGDSAPTVTICHLPPGNPTNVQLITVGAPAVPAHLAHGDLLTDCAGTCGGTAEVDCAGTCGGTAEVDCAGTCGGTAEVDCAGTCGGTAEVDCAGVCGGTAEVDCAGVCDGPGTQCGDQCCSDGETCADGECVAVGVCENFTGTGCYWMENTSGNFCWVYSPSGFPSDVAHCQDLDSCSPNGGHSSGGGCYRWADCSLCSTIYPNPTWP
jgi:hypothetical protein